MWQLSQNPPVRHASLYSVKRKISTQNGANTVMAEDIATEIGLIGSGSSDQTLSPGAIVGLMLEIQSSLLQTPEHAHLSDAAEDLLLNLVRSIKNTEIQTTTGADGAKQPVQAPASIRGRPQLRIVKDA
jgi:hypothetical protein